MKRFVISMFTFALIVVVGLSFAGCSGKPKTYTCSAGLKVTMEGNFYEKELVSQTYYLESKKSIFVALKEKFSSFNSPSSAQNMTLKEYATLVIKNNKMQDSITAQEDESGQVYFAYFKNVSGKDFYYFAVVKKGTDAFWLCQFACEKKNQQKFETKFKDWGKTIQVS